MNASDIIKERQNKTLFQAYYRPNIFSDGNSIVSTINYCPVSSLKTGTPSYVSSVTTNYLYTCQQPVISYELANSINQGKYNCPYPYCSSISVWQTGQTFPTGVCNCKISNVQWVNNISTTFYTYSTTNLSSISILSTSIMAGNGPVICPLVEFYQGTNFDNKCSLCNILYTLCPCD